MNDYLLEQLSDVAKRHGKEIIVLRSMKHAGFFLRAFIPESPTFS